MTSSNYWLSVFNAETWREFKEAGGTTVGFPPSQLKTVTKLEQGDYILAYMTKISNWFAVLKVTSEAYTDNETVIWSQAQFPCRVQVKIVHQLEPDQGIYALDLAPQLSMFDHLKTYHWGLLFRSAPKAITPEDGSVIMNAIKKQES